MNRSRLVLPLTAAALGLFGAAAATISLHRAASEALDRSLAEQLRAAGETAALLVARTGPSPATLRAVMRANQLDGAWIADASLRVVADAADDSGVPANPLRMDLARIEEALAGESSIAPAYALGELAVATGYFPLRDASGRVTAVLGLEAGEPFTSARRGLARALGIALAISAAGAGALAFVAALWARSESARAAAAISAARGDATARMAATAAHEIRNPLGVIRGTVELMRERGEVTLSTRDKAALDDVLGEVERLRRLTQDFLDLSSERLVANEPVDLAAVLDDAARGVEAANPGIAVRRSGAPDPRVRGDAGRLRQVFANLLANAAQAQGEGEVWVEASVEPRAVRVTVRDSGPGISPDARERLFEPFFTTKDSGTGLGLALSRRIAERHGGALRLVEAGPAGAVFEVRLPVESG
jgi:two-component system, OmpR family, sensor kinase